MQIRIQILLLIKVIRICAHWSTNPPGLRFEPPRLFVSVQCPAWIHVEPLKLLNFDFDADPEPAFHSNSDPGQLPEIMRIWVCKGKFQDAVESNAIAAPSLIIL
jgi:hypothetical protein